MSPHLSDRHTRSFIIPSCSRCCPAHENPMKNKWLFDLLPVILFFAAFKLADIYIATAVAIAASVLQIGWLLVKKRPVDAMQWVGLAIIVAVYRARRSASVDDANLLKF